MLGVMANGKNLASHKYTVETSIKTLRVSHPQIGFSFFTLIQNTFCKSVYSGKLECRVLF
jgi:hypothetical protein